MLSADQRLSAWLDRHARWFTPLLLLFVCVLAYGLLIPWLGFYWDDWPKALFAETIGPRAFTRFAAHRPINGWWYILSLSFLKTSPLAWQLYALFWRWASALAFWVFLRNLWPRRGYLATGAALLFAVYPGFQQNNIALSFYIHSLAHAAFFFSMALTVKAIRSLARSTRFHAAALLLSLITILTTDYYYGLELIRPLVIYLALEDAAPTRARWRTALRHWAPYLLLTAAAYAWRLSLDAAESYDISIVETLESGPATLGAIISTWLGDLVQGALSAWTQTITTLAHVNWASRVELFGLALVIASAAALYVVLSRLPSTAENPSAQALLLGGWALVVANIPFWASGLAISLNFPANRLTLPMAAGAALLLAGLLQYLRPAAPRALALALLVGLAIGFQFHTANAFRQDGEDHADFWAQFTWRAPTLAPGTAILSEELPLAYYSDDSLTGAVNLIYPSSNPDEALNDALFFLDLRLGSKVPSLEAEQPIYWDYRLVEFNGSTSDAIAIYYAPPACLRILDPVMDAHNPLLTPATRDALPLSRPELASAADGVPAQPPAFLATPSTSGSWCYYFEKADLARQNEDWAQVAALGDIAFQLGDSPNHASERVPFIEGYAHTGRYERSLELSREALDINSFMGPMLCDAWARIDASTPASGDKESAISALIDLLTCDLGEISPAD